ncbi:mechanosensitive ion channel family protein [Halococcus sp. AFM35]|uniref:mechanosensitive ion channel family protein n=1 Tax=Halococcus sp. AFM35 TaxID=3421653 RepID=UPI003EBD168F
MTRSHTLADGTILQTVPDSLQPLVNGLLSAIPLIIGAIIILLLGLILGRILGGVVKRVVQSIRPAQYTEGTALEREGDVDSSVAQSLGDLTKYIVYLLALLAALSFLGIGVPGVFLTDVAGGLVQIIVAVAILIVGVAIGRFVGSLAGDIVAGFGLDSYVRDTPVADATDSVGGISNAVGRLVEYLIYLFALLIALDYAGIAIPGGFLTNVANGAVQVIVAGVILVAGFAIGRFVGDLVGDIVAGFGLDGFVRDTPLADLTDAVGGIGNAVGKLVEFLIYYFALVAAVDALDFPALSEPLTDFIGQIPLLLGGLAVLVVGIYVADLLGDLVANADRSRAADIAGLAVQLFVYYIVIVFALDTAGFDTSVLTTLFTSFVTALFGALGLALAIAIGIGLGWGSKDYVAENIDDWVGSARESADDLAEESDSESDDGFESPGSTDD